jgi:hypothetical protein
MFDPKKFESLLLPRRTMSELPSILVTLTRLASYQDVDCRGCFRLII